MAKQLIATLVTNSNGEAFYTYTGTGAGQTTFIAESGELESNSLTINDINQELTITADKNILSYADNESCTITATYEGPSVNGQTVVFKNGNTILATKTTDSNGIATYDYQSQGIGDVTITVECMNLQETYELQDIYFARMTEYSATKNDGYVVQKFIDDSTSLALPSNFEMEFKYKTTGGSSSAEMRLFIMPRSLYVSNSQPSYGWFIGDTGCSSWEFGCRRSGTTSSVHKSGLTCNEWHTVKFTQSSDNTRVYCYVDGDFFDYYTLTDISNYSDYCFCFHNWANGTMSIKDIMIKEL